MSDRFKFRVWDKEIKQYIDYGQWLSCAIEFNFNPFTKEVWCEFDDSQYIVEQCTGLRDKNGKLIYEGDVVRQISKCEPEYEEYITEVKWCGLGYSLYDKESFDYEVIGNIHENPELLEQEDE